MRADEDELRSLMIGGLDGDAAAHAALLRLLVPLLRGFYRRRARGDDDDIEDLVQETLMAVHGRRATYDRDRPFTGWLFAIARYKMIDHFRRKRRLQPIDGLEDELVARDFEAPISAEMDVAALLGTLPPKQAHVIRATRIDGLSVAEAAAAAGGLGESDVKVSVHRGLKALIARVQGEVR
ncbi:sigma-70 family RNA polymerase sigma factor [Sphingomonas mali]|uniref:sigma-70 family RNA polymerase sigma factor n=1 Tax=Sphingomonas mali TaxID=40682 RepID=UPI0008376C13|nr:sigma-70 family RNA polymerase sigma factor [Sphingomonas mali]